MASLTSTVVYNRSLNQNYFSPSSLSPLPSSSSSYSSSPSLKSSPTSFKLASCNRNQFRRTSWQLINSRLSQNPNYLFSPSSPSPLPLPQSSFSTARNPKSSSSSIVCEAENGKPKGGESFDFEFDFDGIDASELKADIQRLESKRQAEKMGMSKGSRYYQETEGNGASKGGGIRDVLDKILVADFFFILAILAWFLAGIGQKQLTGETSLLNSWLPLWMPLFQPALGVFMAGALISAFNGWRKKDQ